MSEHAHRGRRPALSTRLLAGVRRLVQIHVWGMDIHPTAWIEPSAYIDRTWPRGVHIGQDCVIGDQAVVLTHDFTRGVYLDTRIGARCHVGPRAIVLPGLTIGEDCVLMPGALVTKDMPPNFLAVGNPAEYRPRDQEQAPAPQEKATGTAHPEGGCPAAPSATRSLP